MEMEDERDFTEEEADKFMQVPVCGCGTVANLFDAATLAVAKELKAANSRHEHGGDCTFWHVTMRMLMNNIIIAKAAYDLHDEPAKLLEFAKAMKECNDITSIAIEDATVRARLRVTFNNKIEELENEKQRH